MTRMKLISLRTIFQLLAFGIFLYQMHQAILKYLSKPLVTERSTEPIETINKPLMYICQENQFNYTRAQELGYSTRTQFLAGKVNGSVTPSWLGTSTNQSYEEIVKDLFIYNYTGLTVENADEELIFSQSNGFCKQILNFSMNSKQEVQSYKTIKLLTLDPYRQDHYLKVNQLSLRLMMIFVAEIIMIMTTM